MIFKGPPRLPEEGTSLLCKSAPDICASNPQSAISYVDKADLSHMLPAYPETKIIEQPRFVATGFSEKPDQSVVDSRLSGFIDKEGLVMDSRLLSESRQNVIAFTEDKEHANCQEPPPVHFSDFSLSNHSDQQQHTTLQQQPPLAFADNEPSVFINGEQQHSMVVDSLLDAPYGYDTRYNNLNLAGQTVPITLKHHHHQPINNSSQYHYQNFGTIHSGVLRVSEPGTSSTTSSNCSSQRSMTLQNPKRKAATSNAQIAQNAFSTLECEKRKRGGGGSGGSSSSSSSTTTAMQLPKTNFCAGSAVWPPVQASVPR